MRAGRSKKNRSRRRRTARPSVSAGDDLRPFLEGLSDRVWEIDTHFGYRKVTGNVQATMGYEPSEMEGKNIHAFMPPEEADRFEKTLRDIASSWGKCSGLIFHYYHKDRSLIAVRSGVTALFDARGVVRGYRGIDRVTGPAVDQGGLAGALKTLVHTSMDIVFTTDPDGFFTYINPEFTRFYGYEWDELVGKTTPRILKSGKQPFEYFESFWRTLRNQKTVQGEFFNKTKNGLIVHVESTVNPILDESGTIAGYLAIQRDITDRIKAEMILRESEARYRQIFETTPAGIFQYDNMLRITSCNERFTAILKSSRDKLIGLDLKSLKDTNVLPAIVSVVEGQEGYYDGRYHTTTSDTDVWVSMRTSPVWNVEGQVVGGIGIVQDITGHIRVEEAIAEREQRYRTLFDLSPSGILLEDSHGTIMDINDSLCDSLGYSKQELLGRNFRTFLLPEDIDQMNRHHEEVLAGKTLEHVEVCIRKDGARCSMGLRETKISLPNGGKGILVVANDVTERIKAEEALEESEQRYRQLIDLSPDAIAVHSGGKIVFVNQAGVRMFGASSADDLIGRSIYDVVHPDSQAMVKQRVRRMTTKGVKVPVVEEKFIRLDGSSINVDVVAMPFVYLGVPSILVVIRDITERKMAEEALGKSEEQLRLISENVVDLITLLDTSGKRLYTSPSYREALGDPSELLGKDFFDWIHPGDKERVRQIFDQTVATGSSFQVEYRTISKDGEIRFIESRGNAIRDQLGATSRVVMVSRDTTEKKRLDEHILRVQRMDSLGTLAGGIAHDLNNVLTPILLAAEILDNRFTQPQIKQLISSIRVSALRGSDIVKQVLTFARGSDQQFSAQQPRYIIREIESIIRETFPRTIELRTNIAKDLKTVFADPTQLHQILMNLCVNARDAMPKGGHLLITAANVDIDETFARMYPGTHPGEYVLITVGDTGVGIPKEIQDKIFEPFFTTKEIGKGTGLGLSTVLAIVKDHKGFIRTTSQVGKGSEFNIYLPAMPQEQAADQKKSAKIIPSGKGERILVVDDELSVLQITKETLEIYNYRVLTSTDGADAVAIFADAKKGSIDLVITDLNMPVMDGAATVHALRRIDPKVKIIVSSGLLTEMDPVKLAMLNIQGSLTKPYSADKLVSTVHRVLNEKDGS